MTAHVITYANKSSGMFESLTNNKFNVPIKVLGMGTKWNGFMDKVKGYRDHVKTLPDKDIVVIVDGFDTQVNGTLETAVSRFQKLNKSIVVSRDPTGYTEIIARKVFGTCANGYIGNSGLMMGRADNMYNMLYDMSNESCNDDQRGLNTVCTKHDVHVDADNIIFENTPPNDRTIKSDAVFIGFPGAMNISRGGRALLEYTQFFIVEILVAFVFIALLCKRFRLPISVFMVFMAVFVDVSCA